MPRFRIRKQKYAREISTEDEPYPWADYGTKPHIIRPVRAPKLMFQKEYKRKTLTGKILSRQGGKSGPTVVADVVHHPGNEPANLSQTIAEKWDDELPIQMQRAINAEVA